MAKKETHEHLDHKYDDRQATATGGVVLVVGIGAGSVDVPLSSTLLREVDIRGSFRIVNT